MKINGFVYKIQGVLYLSLIGLNNKCTDGIPIDAGNYATLLPNQLSFVDVHIKNRSMDVEMDVFEWANECMNYKQGDISYDIKDIMIFDFQHATVEKICEMGDFQIMADNIINKMESIKVELLEQIIKSKNNIN